MNEPPAPPMDPPARVMNVLFVCLGNICRSPLAGALFTRMAQQRGAGDRFFVDTCGTSGWHKGEDADPRTLAVARNYNVPIKHCARSLAPIFDFAKFDLMLAMDRANRNDLLRAGAPQHKVRLIREFDAEALADSRKRGEWALDVPDPYQGGAEGFDRMYHMLARACAGLLDQLLGAATPPARPGGPTGETQRH